MKKNLYLKRTSCGIAIEVCIRAVSRRDRTDALACLEELVLNDEASANR